MAWQTKSCKVKILLLRKYLWFIFDRKIFNIIRFENISSMALKKNKQKNDLGNIVKAALQIWE